MRVGPFVALAPLLALTACGEGEKAPNELGTLPTFVVADKPELTIGVPKGSTPYLLSGVSDATRQSDGSIVVADCISAELRYFDRDGRFLRAVGGQGEGPGEFRFLRRVFRLGGDTLGAYDGFGWRITVVAPDGAVERTVPLTREQFLPDVLGWLDGGRFVARRFDRTPPSTEPSSIFRSTVSLLLIDERGSVVDSLVGLPANDAHAGASPRTPTRPLRLARSAVLAVHPGGLFYGGQDATGIVELNPALDTVGVTRTRTRPEPVSETMQRAFQAMVDDRAHIPRGGVGSVLSQEYVDSAPAFGHILAGREGWLWVQDPFRPGHQPLVWTAYEDGEALARIELPPRFAPFEFGRDWVLGVAFDALDIERVQLWHLVPGEPAGWVLPPRDAETPNVERCGAWASR